MSLHSDEYLIDKIRKGDWRNYAVLVDKYKTRIFNFVLIIVKNREDAEEIVQDSFTKAFGSLHQFKGDAKFSTWLLRIARNTSLTSLRKSKPVKVELNEYATDELKVNSTSILASADHTNIKLILSGALNELKMEEISCFSILFE